MASAAQMLAGGLVMLVLACFTASG